jgi:hypothetical protein
LGKKSARKDYTSKKSKILNNYDKRITIFRKVLLQQLDISKTEMILGKVKEEYKTLIPEIYLIESQKNFLMREFKNISIALAFAKVMKRYEYSKEEIAVFIYELQKEMYSSAIEGKINLMGVLFSILHSFPINKIYRKLIKKYEKRALKREKTSNIQIHYVEGDGKDFDYGIDILSCPIYDIWQKHNVIEILPYICLFDFFKSAMTNSGLIRTMTLSEGRKKCDNRFKKGQKPQNRQKTQFITRESLSK